MLAKNVKKIIVFCNDGFENTEKVFPVLQDLLGEIGNYVIATGRHLPIQKVLLDWITTKMGTIIIYERNEGSELLKDSDGLILFYNKKDKLCLKLLEIAKQRKMKIKKIKIR